MSKVRITVTTVGVVIAAVTMGMVAPSWAAVGSTSWGVLPGDASGPVAHAIPHTAADPQLNPEATYRAITPCRIVSTVVAGGKFANGETRSIYVGGTTGFTPQGGKSGGCGIPVGATAVAATVTAAQSTTHGFVRAWPAGQTEPTATILSYPATTLSTGTGATLSLNTTTGLALRVKNYGGPTNIIIDVSGYYDQQIQALIGSGGGIEAGSARVVSTSHPGTGSYYVTLDRPVRQCAVVATSFNLYHYISTGLSSMSTPNTISVYTWTLNGTTHLETPTDYDFFLTVTC